ncbi:ABC transporter ATP-binding protein [Tomitella cavernea]|uniref:ABC transporter ATP-binding protein n=1 Tax=Tomitella cavernea TaxID=1387982 RepID=A0ABP9D2E0_9ACTN|nr:ABC transporter ATP-binding protein [Tomitella cavernea]
MDLTIEGLTVEASTKTLVRDVGLAAHDGEVVGLVGPNGSGKSTILKCTYRALRPTAGRILLGDADLRGMTMKQSALRLAALSQQSSVEFGFTVDEVVATGRLPHTGLLGRDAADARQVIAGALHTAGAEHLSGRSFLELSGGERQRVLIARALAQQPQVLILDEPTNHLDVKHQIDVLRRVRELGITVVTALHDLNLAAMFCDRIYVLDEGAIVASGTPRQVVTPPLVRAVFGVAAHVVEHPETGAPQLLYSPDTAYDDTACDDAFPGAVPTVEETTPA